MSFLTHFSDALRDVWQYRDEPERFRVLTDVYWRTLLALATVVTLSAAVYGGSGLVSLLAPESESPLLSRSGGADLNRAELKSILDGFEARQDRYELLKKSLPNIADPSR